MNLGDYLVEAARREHLIGVWDCAIFPAEWIVACGHPDPMAGWRGSYSEADDVARLCSEAMAAAGIPETDDPREGDVGVIDIFGRRAGAIFTGRRWALVATRGLAFASLEPANVVKAWRVGRG